MEKEVSKILKINLCYKVCIWFKSKNIEKQL